ncbi:hypothetical protein U9M48_028413 [Paspalum notatum var. saurae]|uniref:Uncharacterized protein n=1 Tax=Paspalum notatum var. saurae TaxID=547442 RepID=A0AAQ3X071_PASNO
MTLWIRDLVQFWPLDTLDAWSCGTHLHVKMHDTRQRKGKGTNTPNAGGRPTKCQVGRPLGWSADHLAGRPATSPSWFCPLPLLHAKKHMCKSIQPLYQASNVSKGRKFTKSWIHDVNNSRDEQCGKSKADMWSPDLLQGWLTYPRRHFTCATTVLTTMGTQDQAIRVQRRWIGWSPNLGLGRPTSPLGQPNTDLGHPPTFASYKYPLRYWTINKPIELICKGVDKL